MKLHTPLKYDFDWKVKDVGINLTLSSQLFPDNNTLVLTDAIDVRVGSTILFESLKQEAVVIGKESALTFVRFPKTFNVTTITGTQLQYKYKHNHAQLSADTLLSFDMMSTMFEQHNLLPAYRQSSIGYDLMSTLERNKISHALYELKVTGTGNVISFDMDYTFGSPLFLRFVINDIDVYEVLISSSLHKTICNSKPFSYNISGNTITFEPKQTISSYKVYSNVLLENVVTNSAHVAQTSDTINEINLHLNAKYDLGGVDETTITFEQLTKSDLTNKINSLGNGLATFNLTSGVKQVLFGKKKTGATYDFIELENNSKIFVRVLDNQVYLESLSAGVIRSFIGVKENNTITFKEYLSYDNVDNKIPVNVIDDTTHVIPTRAQVDSWSNAINVNDADRFWRDPTAVSDVGNLQGADGSVIFNKSTGILYGKIGLQYQPISFRALKVDGQTNPTADVNKLSLVTVESFESLKNTGILTKKSQDNWIHTDSENVTFDGNQSIDMVKRTSGNIKENTLAIGWSNVPSGRNSIVLGSDNTMYNQYSVAIGTGLKTGLETHKTILLGNYNTVDTDGTLLVIGNGTSNTERSNAFKIDAQGNVHVYGEAGFRNSNIPGTVVWTNNGYVRYEDFLSVETFEDRVRQNTPVKMKHQPIDGTEQDKLYGERTIYYVTLS